jgi:copper chaperone
VTEVDVDVPAGRVVVRADGALAEDAVRGAVEEAGFTYVGTASLVP